MRYIGLDISTKTGFAVLATDGEVLDAEEVVLSNQDPISMIKLIHEQTSRIRPDDVVILEGFGYASKQGFLLGGIGWGVRMRLEELGLKYVDVAPTQLKKFATGSGRADKRKLAVEVSKRWGFFHESDNVTDAYVLAQIGRALHGEFEPLAFQREVLKKLKV